MSDTKVHPGDQINLDAFKNFIIGVLKFFFDLTAFTANAIRKNKWYLIIGCLLGAGAGIFYTVSRKPVHQASMVVQGSRITKKTYSEILQQLDDLTKSESTNEVASELGISPASAKNLLSIQTTDMFDRELARDTSSKTNQPFKIVVSLSEKIAPDSLQNVLLRYLNSRPYLQRISDAEIKNAKERLVFIDNDLKKLDTLKSEFNKFLASSKISATIYNNAINPADIYNHSSTLVAQKEMAQKFLTVDNESVLLIDGFKFTKLPKSPGLVSTILAAGVLGLLFGLLISLLIETEKRIVSRRSVSSTVN